MPRYIAILSNPICRFGDDAIAVANYTRER
jgi:hypothetical protein